jgi:hypothetical protein
MTTSTAVSVPRAEEAAPGLPLDPALARELALALSSIRYGTVELVIHEGRVVQLERREKVRLEPTRRDAGR